MIRHRQGDIRLLRDLLADSLRENRKLHRLNAMLRVENACLRGQRAEFDISADSELPALLRRQA